MSGDSGIIKSTNPYRNAFQNDVIIIFYVTLGKCYGRDFRYSKIEMIKFPNPRP